MNRTRRTVADLLAMKASGQTAREQLSMVYVRKPAEARACAEAGIDLLSIEQPFFTPEMRDAAGDCFVQVGMQYGKLATTDDYLRAAHDALIAGGDCCYCAASNEVIARLSAEGIPVVGHVGLIPSRRTWTGGFRAVGKTLDSAMLVMQQVRDLEAAGAFGAEIEVVPAGVTEQIAKRTDMLMLSMGAGTGGDAQYLFAEDILGYTGGHRPRHAKVYRDFAAEYDRLQQERIAAFTEFRADVTSGAYPESQHLVGADDDVIAEFTAALEARDNAPQQ